MKKSELTFMEGFTSSRSDIAEKKGNIIKAFNWDKAAEIIKNRLKDYPNLIAEAGLQGDWRFTGGIIFKEGKPIIDSYTYLSSNWATPTLILSWNNKEQEEIECSIKESERFHCDSKWDYKSLEILGIK